MNPASRVRFVFVLALLTLGACASSTLTGEFAGRPTDQTYYTQYSLMYEKGRFRTTNYRKGILLPVNSPVVFVAGNRKQLKLNLDNGTQLLVQNMERHTGESMEQAFDKLLSTEPLDMSQFTRSEQEGIVQGAVRLGMTRDAVIAAIGYPPATKTPDMNATTWTYAASTWTDFDVVFDDNWRVIECPE